jgi:hypothetical protein
MLPLIIVQVGLYHLTLHHRFVSLGILIIICTYYSFIIIIFGRHLVRAGQTTGTCLTLSAVRALTSNI